jgi:hypothetical protein
MLVVDHTWCAVLHASTIMDPYYKHGKHEFVPMHVQRVDDWCGLSQNGYKGMLRKEEHHTNV